MKKTLLLLTAIASCLLLTCSQAQEIEWQNTIGGDWEDYLFAVHQTNDSGYILGGYSISDISGDKMENSLGNFDYWIVKLNVTGGIQWQNTIGGAGGETLYSMQQTSDGGYILGGNSSSDISSDKTENSLGYEDYWVVKLDPSGNVQWQNTIGGDSLDYLYSIQQTSDGGYICGGYSRSNISGDKTENSLGDYDYWCIKLDGVGNIQWQNTVGGAGRDELHSIQQATDGGYILGGWSDSNVSGDKTENSNGDKDYWVIKLDPLGNIQWQNTIGGNSADWLYTLRSTTDGGCIMGGLSSSNLSGDKTENCWGSYDYWVVKLDLSGNIQWQNTIGGTNGDYLNSIQQTVDGGYILGGASYSNISGDKAENNVDLLESTPDYWILKLDSYGNIIWQNTIGGIDYDWVECVLQTSDEGYIVGGRSKSNISGDKTENGLGAFDYWVIKLTENYNIITGKLFIDTNSNQTQDTGEPAVSNEQITEINTGRFNFSNQNGEYNLAVLDSGNFTVLANGLSYYTTVPTMYTAYFSGIQQIDSLNDFAFQPVGVFNDLCVKITPLGNFRAGMNASYMINYENVGTTTLTPIVIFFPDNDVTFVSANPLATLVTADSVVWNFGPLAPFQTGSILVTVNVNMGTPIGTLINSSVEIDPVTGDANTACNYNSWEVFVTGAVDPNAILVDRDTMLTIELSNPPYLDYIIWFQNTGNDTAFNARVLNNIPQMLDVSSFEFVASSHPMNITYGAHARLMTFTFDNILLPDSNVNEPASHGFIRYSIKPNTTLVAGDSIENTAFIYFDFNQPVQTDTAVTEIVLPTGISHQSLVTGQWSVYPNPASQTITITSPFVTNDKCQMTIFDLFGRKVFEKQLETRNQKPGTTIDVSGFAKGVYVLQLNSGENVYRSKFVKQ